MMDVYTRGKVEGALPVIGFFLKRGYSVVDVKRLAPDEKGGWIETPYERLAKRPRRPYGVRIDYLMPGDATLGSVYYFSCDVVNSVFLPDSDLYRFIYGLGNMTTFIKAGSYLLHWNNFSTVRELVLRPEPVRPRRRHGHPLPLFQARRLGSHALRTVCDAGQGFHQRRAVGPAGGL